MVDMDVSRDHRGSGVEKTWASGEPGAWKACMPVFGGGPLEKGWWKPVPRWRPILPRERREDAEALCCKTRLIW